MRIDEIDFGGRIKLDAYGDGGFRVSGHFHLSSMLLTPTGPKPWRPCALDDVTIDDFAPLMAERDGFEVIMFGTGARFAPPAKANLLVEFMDTGAACRTFNVLLAENRRVAAALLAID